MILSCIASASIITFLSLFVVFDWSGQLVVRGPSSLNTREFGTCPNTFIPQAPLVQWVEPSSYYSIDIPPMVDQSCPSESVPVQDFPYFFCL